MGRESDIRIDRRKDVTWKIRVAAEAWDTQYLMDLDRKIKDRIIAILSAKTLANYFSVSNALVNFREKIDQAMNIASEYRAKKV